MKDEITQIADFIIILLFGLAIGFNIGEFSSKSNNSNISKEYVFHCPVCNEQLEYTKNNSDSPKIICPDCGMIIIFAKDNSNE